MSLLTVTDGRIRRRGRKYQLSWCFFDGLRSWVGNHSRASCHCFQPFASGLSIPDGTASSLPTVISPSPANVVTLWTNGPHKTSRVCTYGWHLPASCPLTTALFFSHGVQMSSLGWRKSHGDIPDQRTLIQPEHQGCLMHLSWSVHVRSWLSKNTCWL